jgi:hypothetical protein
LLKNFIYLCSKSTVVVAAATSAAVAILVAAAERSFSSQANDHSASHNTNHV